MGLAHSQAAARQGRWLQGTGAARPRCFILHTLPDAAKHALLLSGSVQGRTCMVQVVVSSGPREQEAGTDEDKQRAILGAMKNFSLDYRPAWAAVVPEQTWVGLLKEGRPAAGDREPC